MGSTINILLVDDEEPALYNLEEIVRDIMPVSNIFPCDNYLSAVEISEESVISVAILDVEMPGISGIELGKILKNKNPNINIIYCTAYDEYAFPASQLFASGYVLKPVNKQKLKEQFDNLRFPLSFVERKLKINCFGLFEVYYDGTPVQFDRQKSKELLAYLVDRQGARVTVGELSGVLYENSDDEQKNRQNLYSAWFSLKKSLKNINFEEVLIHSQNAYAVDTSLIDCDYYKYLLRDEDAMIAFRGEYMHQYSWAEFSFKPIE